MIVKKDDGAFNLNLVFFGLRHYTAVGEIAAPGYLEVRRCKLDPGLKAPGFKISNLMKIKLAFNLNLVFLSLRHYIEGGDFFPAGPDLCLLGEAVELNTC